MGKIVKGQIAYMEVLPGSVRRGAGLRNFEEMKREVKYESELVAVVGKVAIIENRKRDAKTGELLATQRFELEVGTPHSQIDITGAWEKVLVADLTKQ